MNAPLTEQFLTLQEIVAAARSNLAPGPWSYLIGGAETETTVRPGARRVRLPEPIEHVGQEGLWYALTGVPHGQSGLLGLRTARRPGAEADPTVDVEAEVMLRDELRRVQGVRGAPGDEMGTEVLRVAAEEQHRLPSAREEPDRENSADGAGSDDRDCRHART